MYDHIKLRVPFEAFIKSTGSCKLLDDNNLELIGRQVWMKLIDLVGLALTACSSHY